MLCSIFFRFLVIEVTGFLQNSFPVLTPINTFSDPEMPFRPENSGGCILPSFLLFMLLHYCKQHFIYITNIG